MVQENASLFRQGFALIPLKSRSKQPVDMGWTKGEPPKWKTLEKHRGNIGVRLGCKLKDGFYLGVIDCDVKSREVKFQRELSLKLDEIMGEEYWSAPIVKSGRGNGSQHVYVKSREPLKPRRLAQSPEKVKVQMPSVRPSKWETANLSSEELKNGWRMRPAWEISLMGVGQQVVLPPSIHPDSGKAYQWSIELGSLDDLPVFKDEHPTNEVVTDSVTTNEVTPIDFAKTRLPKSIVDMIVEGEGGTGDLSTDAFAACKSMRACGFRDSEILWALTNPEYAISEVARKRRGNDLQAQCSWISKYVIQAIRTKAPNSKAAFLAEPIDEPEAQARQWVDDLEKTKQGRTVPSLKNLDLILTNAIDSKIFVRDEFAYRDSYGVNTPWGGKRGSLLIDDDVPKIKLWCSQSFDFEPGKDCVYDAMTVISCRNAFDPVKEMLEALPEWDKKPRLDGWLRNHFEAEGHPDYLAQVFRKWFVAMVKRVYEPGAKFDWMPIFEGAQGIGKSSFGKIIAGEKHFLDNLPANLQDKDAALGLQGVWCVEIGELSQIRKEIEPVKAFLTRQIDKVRAPYGRRWMELSRRCVFFGTTNRDTYLIDDTGNRRFKPVKVGQLDFDSLRRDRDQLFAEALVIYNLGLEDEITLNTFDGKALEFERKVQDQKKVSTDADLMFEVLQEFLSKDCLESPNFNRQMFQIKDLFLGCTGEQAPLNKWHFSNRNAQFAGSALKKLRYKKVHKKEANYWKSVDSE